MSEIKTFVGICEYCNAEHTVLAKTQQEANTLAAEKCNCKGFARKKGELTACIKKITDKECTEKGFAPVDDDVCSVLENIGQMVIECKIDKATFKIDGTAISISRQNEKIKVERKKIYTYSDEVE